MMTRVTPWRSSWLSTYATNGRPATWKNHWPPLRPSWVRCRCAVEKSLGRSRGSPLLANNALPASAADFFLRDQAEIDSLLEYLAALRVSVPVSKLAKWKTTLQLVAIGFLIAGPAGERFCGAVVIDMTARVRNGAGWDLGLTVEAWGGGPGLVEAHKTQAAKRERCDSRALGKAQAQSTNA